MSPRLTGSISDSIPVDDFGGAVRRAVVRIDTLVPSDSPRLCGENAEHVEALAQITSPLPPILVHRPTMRVVDGMHRIAAARRRGEDVIEAEFIEAEFPEEGGPDIFSLSVRLNILHGLPLSRADRAAAARRLLMTHPDWSNRRIADNVGLSAGAVATLRCRSTGQEEQLNSRVGRDGRVRPLAATEGRLRASQVITANPNASLREIARQAGIAPATAKDVRDRVRQGQDPLPSRPASAREPASDDNDALPKLPPAHVIQRDLSNMRADPSLRTEAGRSLLQLLSVHSIGDEDRWDRLVRSVPGHRTDTLAQAARRCADHWLRFANELETRHP